MTPRVVANGTQAAEVGREVRDRMRNLIREMPLRKR